MRGQQGAITGFETGIVPDQPHNPAGHGRERQATAVVTPLTRATNSLGSKRADGRRRHRTVRSFRAGIDHQLT